MTKPLTATANKRRYIKGRHWQANVGVGELSDVLVQRQVAMRRSEKTTRANEGETCARVALPSFADSNRYAKDGVGTIFFYTMTDTLRQNRARRDLLLLSVPSS